jgi:hypothetical protein
VTHAEPREFNYKKERPYLITVQFHHWVLDLDLGVLGSHGAGLGQVQGSRSGPAGRRGDAGSTRKTKGRGERSLRGRRRRRGKRR